MPYESGIDTYGYTWGRVGLSFYIYALLFVAFDIEVVFIYLWAMVFRDVLLGGFLAMLLFVLILLIGLGYAWRKGCADMEVTKHDAGATSRRELEIDRADDARPTPIVVAEHALDPANPNAYGGGQPAQIAHLRAAKSWPTSRTPAAGARSTSSRPRPTTCST